MTDEEIRQSESEGPEKKAGELAEHGKKEAAAGVIDYNPLAEEQKQIIKRREEAHKPKPPVVKENAMRKIVIDKVVVNVGVGEAGERLLRAQKAIELLIGSGQRTIQTLSNTTNKDLSIRKEMPIGCKLTLRGQDAYDFVKRAMWVKENKIAGYSFDPEGNFSFGIQDYTTFEKMRYDPDIGIFGLDICISLRRPGYRIKNRKQKTKKVPLRHRITRDEGIEFAKKELGAVVIG